MTNKKPSESLLFNTARQIENREERMRYLADACGDDAGLRERVEKLLVTIDAESQFLEQPAEGLQPTVLLADQHPSVLRQLRNTMDEVPRILLAEPASAAADPIVKPASPELPKSDPGSRYRLDGEIARGGMGAILKGRDTDLGRDLAIKVLLDAHKDNPQVIQRFIEEAQIGGQLQHPGIAPVYELGQFADQRPFFSMKLVKGETLSKLLADRGNPSDERGKFLGIFEQVCQTVAYAHSRNVIHRDLKPANIMVGAFGEVQVMDWGLAKVLSSGGVADERKARDSQQTVSIVQTMRSMGSDAPASFGPVGSAGSETQMGSVMGTPAYMPPEQALGEIDQLDQRSDVFGLGAILAEILTGKPPYVGEDGTQVFRLASRGKLDDCFTRLDTCGADKELIQLTKACLELEPADRPKDAGIVAERVSHYQESVETKLRQTEIQRAAEAARADAEALQAVAERQRAEAEAARAREERQRRRTSLALAASIFLLVGLAAGGWAWITNERNQRIARITREANNALNNAIALSEQAKASLTNNTQLFDHAREQLQRALVLIDNGLTDNILIQQVHDLEMELAEVEKERIFFEEIEDAWLAETDLDAATGTWDWDNSRDKFLSAFSNYGLEVGEADLEQAAQRISGSPQSIKEAISSSLFRLVTDDRIQTDERSRDWIFAFMDATEPDGSFNRRFFNLFFTRENEAELLGGLADIANAFNEIQILPRQAVVLAEFLEPTQSVELLQKAQWRYPEDFHVNTHLAYRMLQASPPQHEEAIRYYTSAIALNGNSAGAHYNLAAALMLAERYEESVLHGRRAIELGLTSPDVYRNLFSAYRGLGNISSAIATCEEGIAKNPTYAGLHSDIGGLYCDYLGKYEKAIQCFETALKIDPEDALAYSNMSVAFYKMGLDLQSKGDYRSAIDKFKEAVDRGLVATDLHYQMGLAFLSLGDAEAALVQFDKSIALNPDDANTHLARGALFCDYKRDYAAAVSSFRRVIEIDPDFEEAYFNLGNVLAFAGDTKEAIAAYQQYFEMVTTDAHAYSVAASLFRQPLINGAFPFAQQAAEWARRATELEPDNSDYQNTLGLALYRTGQWPDASEALLKSIELGKDDPYNWLFLAMTNRQMDQKNKAQGWFDKAVAWKAGHTEELAEDSELKGFFMEAEQLFQPETKDGPVESMNSDSTDK